MSFVSACTWWVKTPGRNVLLEPTVLGELSDQMLLVLDSMGWNQ